MREIRVLLVEDNVINQRVASHMLTNLGYLVDVANHGAEAITILEKSLYDLVLMDCQMLEMDGYTATKIIRDPASRVLNHNVPVIAITAFTTLYNREACFAVGMNDYIEKPVRKNILKEVLEKYLTHTEESVEEEIDLAAKGLRVLPHQTFSIKLVSGRNVEVENISIKMVSPDTFTCHDWNSRQEYCLENVSKVVMANLGETAGPTQVCSLEFLETGLLPQFLISCKLVSDPMVNTNCESLLLAAFFANGGIFNQPLHQILEDNFKLIAWEKIARDYDF